MYEHITTMDREAVYLFSDGKQEQYINSIEEILKNSGMNVIVVLDCYFNGEKLKYGTIASSEENTNKAKQLINKFIENNKRQYKSKGPINRNRW